MVKPFIIGTRNAKDMIHLGAEILREGGSAMDAVEAAVNAVEDNPLDGGVGVGGTPNLLGVTQLDASIMDGRNRRSGAVAGLENVAHAISVARKVLELTPHDLLVGPGAEMFARAVGIEKSDLSTERTRKIAAAMRAGSPEGILEDEKEKERFLRMWLEEGRGEWYEKISKADWGTVNIMAMDANGDMCVGVSTSGLGYKLPGRVGDSPYIGAGNYCDNRFGSAACTGKGELAIRLSSARMIVSYLENGLTLRGAVRKALKDVHSLQDGTISCLVFDGEGNTMSGSMTGESIHYYMDVDSEGPEERKGVWVKP
ncbi:isoaspartyl peptidase/L-asparaginase [Candidatus Bathyarchaeota archaeon]|nr:isoaspartyl peptidase/L-asparaginase [Candidatus Bathyarchaeota archaeon]